MANLRNSSNGNQSGSSSSTSPSSSASAINLLQHHQPSSVATNLQLVDPWLQATQFHQFSNFINQQAAYGQFFPNFSVNNSTVNSSSNSTSSSSLLTPTTSSNSTNNTKQWFINWFKWCFKILENFVVLSVYSSLLIPWLIFVDMARSSLRWCIFLFVSHSFALKNWIRSYSLVFVVAENFFVVLYILSVCKISFVISVTFQHEIN